MKIKILSLVGSTYNFDRLTKQIDELGANSKYSIFAQIGESNYHPRNIMWKKFIDYKEMQDKIKWADIIISHAGIGSIIDILASGKKLILYPRLKKFNEAIDDHQIEICKALKAKYGTDYFTDKIIIKLKVKKHKKHTNENRLVNAIKKSLEW